MNNRSICILFILLITNITYADFIPNSTIESPVIPEAYNYQNILNPFGQVNKQSCDLNIVSSEITLPGKGLLTLNISRSYSSKIKEQQKSSGVINNYIYFFFPRLNYFKYNIKFTFGLSLGADFSSYEYGSPEWKVAVDGYFQDNFVDVDKYRTDFKRTLNENYDIQTFNHFYENQQNDFGVDWQININRFSRIYLYELYLQDTSHQGEDDQENTRYYWKYKAVIRTPESGNLLFEKDYKNHFYEGLSDDHTMYNSLKTIENNIGEWDIAGYDAQNIKNEEVIKKKNYKFIYDNTTDTYTLISANGIKYTFNHHQKAIFHADYNQPEEDHPTHQRVKKDIVYLTKIEDKYGNAIQIIYKAGTHEIEKIIDSCNREINFIYSAGEITKITYPGDSGLQEKNYTYNINYLSSAKNELNQTTSYFYNTDEYKQINRIDDEYGLSVRYSYDKEKQYEVGYDPNNPPEPPPEQPIIDFLLPNSNNIVTKKEIYDNGTLKRTENYSRTAYYRYIDGDGDGDGDKEQFYFDTAIVSIQMPGIVGTDKTYIYKYNQRGLLEEVQQPLSYINRYAYQRSGQYYIQPTHEILNIEQYCEECPGQKNIIYLNKKENFYDVNGIIDYSLIYKNGDDAQYYYKNDYTVETVNYNEYFLYLNKQMDIYNTSGSLLRSDKANYNTQGDLTGIEKKIGPAYITTTSLTYNTTYPWQITQIQDAEGIKSYYGYDSTYHMYLTSIGNDVYTENFEYYLQSGNIKKITDKNNNITELQYDKLNRLTENKKTGINIITSIEYNDAQRKVTTRKKYNTIELLYSEKQYNNLGQLIEENSIDRNTGLELKQQYEYYPSGTLKKHITNPEVGGNEKLVLFYDHYDLLDRPTRIIYPNYSIEDIKYGFDPNNKLQIKTTVNIQKEKKIECQDYAGRLIAIELTKDDIGEQKKYRTEYKYNEFNQLLEYKQNPTNSNPLIGTKQYDSIGRLSTETEPGGITKTYTYYNNDKIKTITTPKGIQTFTYDNIGRLKKIDYPNNPDINYYYDDVTDGNKGLGELTKVEKQGICSTSFQYDVYNRLLKEIKRIDELNKNYTQEYHFDNYENIDQITRPDGKIINFNNDYSGNIKDIKYNTKTLAEYTYNNLGNIIQTKLNENKIGLKYNYYKGNQITEISASSLINTNDKYLYYKYTYTYDYLSYREDINKNTISYKYDDITGMLREVIFHDQEKKFTYNYDDFFNRTLFKHVYGQHDYHYQTGNNRLDYYLLNNKNNAKIDLSYDNEGNTSLEKYTYNNKTEWEKQYTWNDQNELTKFNHIKHPNNNKLTTITNTASYQYDENGNLLKYIVNGKIKYFLYDSDGVLLGETDSTGNINRSFIYGVNGKEAIIDNTEATEKIYYYLRDLLGTSCRMIDENNEIVLIQDISPFGNMIHSRKTYRDNDRFTGKDFFEESGLIYFGARWYNPNVGRFLSRDLVKEKLKNPFTFNSYIYSWNNPLKYVDPDGKYPYDIGPNTPTPLLISHMKKEIKKETISYIPDRLTFTPLATYTPWGSAGLYFSLPLKERLLYGTGAFKMEAFSTKWNFTPSQWRNYIGLDMFNVGVEYGYGSNKFRGSDIGFAIPNAYGLGLGTQTYMSTDDTTFGMSFGPSFGFSIPSEYSAGYNYEFSTYELWSIGDRDYNDIDYSNYNYYTPDYNMDPLPNTYSDVNRDYLNW